MRFTMLSPWFSPCKRWSDKLMVRTDTLSHAEQADLLAHLSTCSRCHSQYTAFQTITNDLQRLSTTIRLPADREERLYQLKVYHELQEKKRVQEGPVTDPVISVVPHGGISIKRLLQRPLSAFPVAQRKQPKYVRSTFSLAVLIILTWVMFTFSNPYLVSADTLKLDLIARKPRNQSVWVHKVAWSPSPTKHYVASLWDDNIMQVWNADTGRELFHEEIGWGAGVAWSPDGKLLATIDTDNTLQILDVAQCQLYSDCQPTVTYKGHTDHVEAIAWSPDGTMIASASDDKTVQVWNASTGENIYTYRDSSYQDQHQPAWTFYAVAWSPDSKRIVSGDGDGHVSVWDAETGGHLLRYTGHQDDPITSISWLPGIGSSTIASSGYKGVVRIWDANTGKTKMSLSNISGNQGENGANNVIYNVSWSPDGNFLAIAGSDTIQVRFAANGAMVGNPYKLNVDAMSKDPLNGPFTVAWSPDSQHIVSGGQNIILTFHVSG